MCLCCFISSIPKSTKTRFILRPIGKLFINGISSLYETGYFEELKPYISQIHYDHVMNRIVENHDSLWPCDFCFYYGYLMIPCTLGLSLLFPNCCIGEAKKSFLQDIEEANDNYFHPNLHLSLQKRYCISWLEIDIIGQESNEPIQEDSIKNDRTDSKIDDLVLIRNQLE